jgi:hypothetical protein
LVDSQTDSSLYTAEDGRRGVDLLCEYALALALEYTNQGMEVSIGYTGGDIHRGTQGELAAALAYPAAFSLSEGKDLPLASEDQGVLILSLPRAAADTAALDRFLRNRGTNQRADILFIYEGERLTRAAETCVRIYRQKSGVHPRQMRV